MNKKFLSAILFGALMVTSTGTFVSCKDYDDDIKDLQEQINSNKDAIATLQKLVGEGNWVTGITSIADGFTVTMSNGQSTTITGIKGEDGKNGVEWTIGDDGFWYKDGEKTDHQAVAEDGKPGATAPSPSISADGKWVVYEWDATKGEFVAKTTEIPAQGTSAYVVKKDGVYVLHIADETGAYQDVTLPATSDSFVVEAPAAGVTVMFEYATWKPQTAKEAYKALVAKYPEIAKIEDGSLVNQGGNLPVLVTPAAVELTDKMSYELINMKGEVVDIEVANPTKGLPATASMDKDNFTMTTRAASSTGFWTLSVEPSLNEKGTAYVTTENKAVSLAVTNEKGTTVNTPYAYIIDSKLIAKGADVDFDNVTSDKDGKMTSTADYASSIDLFGLDEDGNSPIALQNEYLGYCFVSFTEPLQVEQYGLSIDDNNVLTIANMPSDVTSIKINVKVTALGLNGSVMSKDAVITINQKIASDIQLADKPVVLADAAHAVNVRWNITDLKFNNIQLDKFVKASVANKLTISLTREDKEGKYVAFNEAIKCYKADGKTVATDYKDAVTFGFSVSGVTGKDETGTEEIAGEEYTWEQILPEDYTITLIATEGTSQFFTAEATLKVSNPTAAAIKLVAEFVENNTLQAVGVVNDKVAISDGRPIVYDLNKGIVKSSNITIDKYVDVDYENFVASGSSDTKDMASQNWFENDDSELTVYAYHKASAEKDPATFDRLDKTRNIRIEYHLFGNKNNTDVFEFPIVVKSAVYSATPEKVITMDEDALTAVFGGADDADKIDLSAITEAVLAAGPDAGKSYDLFTVFGKATTKYYNNYAKRITSAGADVTYVVNSNSVPVEIEVNDLKAFGFTADQILDANNGDKKFYLIEKINDSDTYTDDYADVMTFADLWNQVNALDVYEAEKDEDDVDIANTYKLNSTEYNKLNADNKALVDLFAKYAAKVAFEQVSHEFPAVNEAVDPSLLNGDAKVDYVDKATGEKFATISGSTIKAVLATGVSVPGDKVEVPFKLTINDAWGKTMVYQFTATFTTK